MFVTKTMASLPAIVLFVALSVAGAASAQSVLEPLASEQGPDAPALKDSTPSAVGSVPDRIASPAALPTWQPPRRSLFKSFGNDVPSFFSTDTAKILGSFALISMSVRPADGASVEDAREHVSPGVANVGNVAGSLYAQAGGAVATYVIGRATGNPKLASLGGDLLRAQALAQIFVQGTKFTVGRQRPDGSNSQSFPSGHSASAFATATVLQQSYGWKAGAPAYAFAGFIAASRMSSNKHYLSDVLMGAGIGIAAGRTVTLNLGSHLFSVGAAPTAGGAMVTFVKH